MFDVSVDTSEVISGLNTLEGKIVNSYIPDSLKKVSNQLLSHVRTNVPIRTGNLSNSLRRNVTKDSIEIEATASYASFVDLGYVIRTPKVTKKIPGKFFMHRALQQAKVEREVAQTLDKRIGN